MSSQASEAELDRIFKSEKQFDVNHVDEVATPRSTADVGCLVHVGACFGPRKDSCPRYPHCIELEGEASRQPDPSTPRGHYAHRLQHSPKRGLPHSPPTPTLTPTQREAYMSPMEWKLFESRRLDEQERGLNFTRLARTHESTPAQSPKSSPATTASYNDHADDHFLHRDDTSDYAPHRDTPSTRSRASGKDEPIRGGIGPFQPHPYSEYHRRGALCVTNEHWENTYIWNHKDSS